MKKKLIHPICLSAIGLAFVLSGCKTKHEIEMKPIEVKPMEVTLNINLNIKMVNDELDALFGETEE